MLRRKKPAPPNFLPRTMFEQSCCDEAEHKFARHAALYTNRLKAGADNPAISIGGLKRGVYVVQ